MLARSRGSSGLAHGIPRATRHAQQLVGEEVALIAHLDVDALAEQRATFVQLVAHRFEHAAAAHRGAELLLVVEDDVRDDDAREPLGLRACGGERIGGDADAAERHGRCLGGARRLGFARGVQPDALARLRLGARAALADRASARERRLRRRGRSARALSERSASSGASRAGSGIWAPAPTAQLEADAAEPLGERRGAATVLRCRNRRRRSRWGCGGSGRRDGSRPSDTRAMTRRLSLRLISSQTWKPNIFGSAASSTTARGSARWIERIASTPSWATRTCKPSRSSASAMRLQASAFGCAMRTRRRSVEVRGLRRWSARSSRATDRASADPAAAPCGRARDAARRRGRACQVARFGGALGRDVTGSVRGAASIGATASALGAAGSRTRKTALHWRAAQARAVRTESARARRGSGSDISDTPRSSPTPLRAFFPHRPPRSGTACGIPADPLPISVAARKD